MKNFKKAITGIIAAIIFISLAVGATLSTGVALIVISTGMALHVVQSIIFLGRTYEQKDNDKDMDIPTGFVYPRTKEKEEKEEKKKNNSDSERALID